MSKTDLTDRVVLITGASRGIGYATASAALQAGARVVMGAQTPERLERAAGELAALGEVAQGAIDVADYGDMAAFTELALTRFGRADVLVNDAGVAWAGPFAEMPPAEIEATVDVNVGGVLNATRAVLPHMLARGTGTVINISSGAGHAGIGGLAAYCASKFAVNGFTEALADEVGDAGVGVYAVCPGRVATDMQETVSGRRQGLAPERIAEAVLDLLGPRPPVRPGQCVDVFR